MPIGIYPHKKQDLKKRFEKNIEPITETGCHLWTASCFKTGYGKINIDGKIKKAHRVAWEIYCSPIPEGMNVLHSCDIQPCVNYHHLFLGTFKDNMTDMIKKNRQRHPNGEANHAKLTKEDVLKIRSDNRSCVKIANDYPVSETTINQIKLRKKWKHV